MTTNRGNLIYPELSYKIIGILFDVYNELGGGYQEKYYQRALAKKFKKENLRFKEQIIVPLKFEKEKIGQYFFRLSYRRQNCFRNQSCSLILS